MKTRKKIILLLFFLLITINNCILAQTHPNDNLWYNNGAEVYIGSNCLVTVQGDVTNNKAGSSGIVQFTNNGFLWVQGNMYGDNAFSQAGTGVVRLQNKTGLYDAIYASENYQMIDGGYQVHGNQSAIGTTNDGSFFTLELDNSTGSVFIAGNTDVRNSIDFKPGYVTVDGITILPNGLTNTLHTYNPGNATSPSTPPINGSDYAAVFGMMNPIEGLSNFKNCNPNLTSNTGNIDSGYIQGNLRRAIDPINGGAYGFPIGLEPGVSGRGLQYAILNFGANNYNVVNGYFQQGVDNTVSLPPAVCNLSNSYLFYSQNNHGSWFFLPSASSSEPYNLTIYPRSYGTLSSALFFITQNNTVPNPNTQNCTSTPFGLSVTNLQGFGSFGFGGGVTSVIPPNSSSTTPLPINLQRFEGRIEGCDVTLEWQIDNGVKFRDFIISTSNNGINFKEIGTIKYDGNSLYNFQYLQKQSVTFYRLTLVDLNNNSIYSNIISLRGSCNQNKVDFMVTPNPTFDILSVFELPTGKKQIRITNVLGNTVFSLLTSETAININMLSFTPGMYNVSITDDSGFIKTKKIIKR